MTDAEIYNRLRQLEIEQAEQKVAIQDVVKPTLDTINDNVKGLLKEQKKTNSCLTILVTKDEARDKADVRRRNNLVAIWGSIVTIAAGLIGAVFNWFTKAG